MTQLETQFDVNLTEPEAADAGMARALEEELRQLDGELELEQHARGLVGSSRSDDGARGGNGRRSLRGAAARGHLAVAVAGGVRPNRHPGRRRRRGLRRSGLRLGDGANAGDGTDEARGH